MSDTTTARLDVLEAQLRHVEAALEGLQDAVHRRALLDDRRNEDLQQRTQPARLARDLSDDARARSMSNHDESDLERARAEVRYQRERLALYRARMYRQPASPASKLHELERALQGAQERLRRAEHDRP